MNSGLFDRSGPDLWLRIRGRTVGAIVCTGFGTFSLYCGTVAANGQRKLWLYLIGVLAAALLICSFFQLRAMRRATRPRLSQQLRRFYRIWFAVIITLEVIAIILGGPILAHFNKSNFYPNWIDGVVGIHFIPLARLFKLPLYYATGAAISLVALSSLLISNDSLRVAICAGGTGLALWITGGLTLYENLSCLPGKDVPQR